MIEHLQFSGCTTKLVHLTHDIANANWLFIDSYNDDGSECFCNHDCASPYINTQEFTTDKHHVHVTKGDKRFVNTQSIFIVLMHYGKCLIFVSFFLFSLFVCTITGDRLLDRFQIYVSDQG